MSRKARRVTEKKKKKKMYDRDSLPAPPAPPPRGMTVTLSQSWPHILGFRGHVRDLSTSSCNWRYSSPCSAFIGFCAIQTAGLLITQLFPERSFRFVPFRFVKLYRTTILFFAVRRLCSPARPVCIWSPKNSLNLTIRKYLLTSYIYM